MLFMKIKQYQDINTQVFNSISVGCLNGCSTSWMVPTVFALQLDDCLAAFMFLQV